MAPGLRSGPANQARSRDACREGALLPRRPSRARGPMRSEETADEMDLGRRSARGRPYRAQRRPGLPARVSPKRSRYVSIATPPPLTGLSAGVDEYLAGGDRRRIGEEGGHVLLDPARDPAAGF